jgi:methionyl-tRNA formyltransferase
MNNKLNTILFMASSSFAMPTLEELHQKFKPALQGIFTRADKPRGRGQHLHQNLFKKWALSYDIPCYTPLNKAELVAQVKALNPDLIIVIAYGLIFPKELTDQYFCLNVHASLLPKYRGPSPIQTALLNGDQQTGLTLMHMNEKMDEGAILSQATITINETDNLMSLHEKLSLQAAPLLSNYLKEQIATGQIKALKQDHAQASYCHKIHSSDLEITEQNPQLILHKIRAFAPRPGAYIYRHNKRIKILDAKIEKSELILITVQPEGKKPMSYQDYLLAHDKIIF